MIGISEATQVVIRLVRHLEAEEADIALVHQAVDILQEEEDMDNLNELKEHLKNLEKKLNDIGRSL